MDKFYVGTSKGMLTFENGKEVDYQYEGLNITAIYKDYVAITHKHWGCKLFKNGLPINTPRFTEDRLTVKGNNASLKQIWQITGGGKSYPNRLWLAVEPGALFKSEDNGASWEINEALWNHPTRIKHGQWFGAGKDLPFLHSIIVHPNNQDCIFVSVSCAGIFRSMDSGRTWNVMNEGMRAEYLPNPNPVAGYDPHQVLMHPTENNVLWQQNHCGIYRSDNGGKSWIERSTQYGFCIAIDDVNSNEAWIIPVENETSRIPKNRKLQVLHTHDAGLTWEDSSTGLPTDNFFGIVLRNGFSKKGDQMIFGTTNGNVYFSGDKGKSWEEITTRLTKVNYIAFANDSI